MERCYAGTFVFALHSMVLSLARAEGVDSAVGEGLGAWCLVAGLVVPTSNR
jgi:hypothetical protein